MDDIAELRTVIARLEGELEEMTIALSQAWDQLVPFLQEVPAQAQTAQDIMPILQAVLAAADSQMAGLYLFQADEWFCLPGDFTPSAAFKAQLCAMPPDHIHEIATFNGGEAYWAFAPVTSDGAVLAALGVGSHNLERTFSALEMRIITRMAERIGGQFTAVQLAHSREREAMVEREMQIASMIQQSLQPKAPPQNGRLHVASHWQPAKQVGGDAWGWVQQPDGRFDWFILDVAGKGLPAALAAVSLHTAIHLALRMQLAPVDVLRVVNEEFYAPYSDTDLMATAVILSLQPQTGRLVLANAGHPPVLVRHQGAWRRLTATAPPIGVLDHLQAEAQQVTLSPGDLALCYSDGFTEIQAETRLWGQTGLLSAVPSGISDIQSILAHIVSAARWAGAAHDDQTLVVTAYQ